MQDTVAAEPSPSRRRRDAEAWKPVRSTEVARPPANGSALKESPEARAGIPPDLAPLVPVEEWLEAAKRAYPKAWRPREDLDLEEAERGGGW